MGELYIAEEAACWERKFMLFKVYLIGLAIETTPACDGQTAGHRTTAKTSLCRASHG